METSPNQGRQLRSVHPGILAHTAPIAALAGAMLVGAGAIELGGRPLAAALGFVGVAGLAAALRGRLDLFEHSAVRRTLLGTRTLRYEDVESIRYRSEWQEYAGMRRTGLAGQSMGVVTSVTLLPFPGKGPPLSFSVRDGDEDPNLIELRDRVSDLVCARMSRELDSAGRVHWAEDVFLARKELQVGATERKVAFSEALETEQDDREWHLFEGAEAGETAVALRTDSLNFFPGLKLFETLVRKMAA